MEAESLPRDGEQPVKSGYLRKTGEASSILSLGASWKHRYCVLYEDRLIYCVDKDTTSTPKGVIYLDEFSSVEEVQHLNTSEHYDFNLFHQHRKRVYKFSASHADERREWINSINGSIAAVEKRHKVEESKSIKVERCDYRIITHPVETYTVRIGAANFSESRTIYKRFNELRQFHEQLVHRFDNLHVSLPPFPSRTLFKFVSFEEMQLTEYRPSVEEHEKRRVLFVEYFNALLSNDILSRFTKHFFVSAIRGENKPILRIRVLEARNLYIVYGTLPYPVCKVCMYDKDNMKLGENRSTSTAKKTLHPKWNEDPEPFYFEPTKGCFGVTVGVWSEGYISSEFMGRLVIPLDTIPGYKQMEHWFPLHPTKSRATKVTGDVRLQIYWEPMNGAPELKVAVPIFLDPLTDSTEDKEALGLRQQQERQRLLAEKEHSKSGDIRLKFVYNPPCGVWEGSLFVTIVGCKLKGEGHSAPDPFVIARVQKIQKQTGVRLGTFHPTYGDEFFFYVHPKTKPSLEISVYDHNRIGTRDLIGNGDLFLPDEQPQVLTDKWVMISSVPCEKNVPKRLGKKMKKAGYVPKLPLILIPGFASSQLRVEEGNPEWKDQLIWLSLTKIGSQKIKGVFDMSTVKDGFKSMFSSMHKSHEDTNEQPPETQEEIVYRNTWIRHMSLESDCMNDPHGIRVRPVKGKEGVSFLTPGAFTNTLSYVMGPLIEELEAVGYTDDNLAALPYDWRLPLHHLEERDGYFTEVKTTIERIVKQNNTPVVILAHSMGNRVTHYFLNWVKQKFGEEWIKQHVHTFFSVGAPWLGAPKSLRSILSGERMGLESFLPEQEALQWGRTLGSGQSLIPLRPHLFFPKTKMQFAYLKFKDSDKYLPLCNDDILCEAGAEKQLQLFRKYYLDNEFFGGEAGKEVILQPPPVSRMYAIYGVNLDTEVCYVYKQQQKGKIVLDHAPTLTLDGYKIVKGIGYETSQTIQQNLVQFTGMEGTRSGDGTVPYQSLNYCAHWKESIPELRIEELDRVEHRAILGNRLFFQRLLEYITEKKTNTQAAPSEFYDLHDDSVAQIDDIEGSEEQQQQQPKQHN